GAEPFLEGVQGGSHQAVDPLQCERLQAQSSAAIQDPLVKVVKVLIIRENMFVQPGNEGLAILDSRLPETEEVPDLGPVILDGAPVPVIVSPFQRCDIDLGGDVLNNNTGDVLSLPGKTPLVLEELQ